MCVCFAILTLSLAFQVAESDTPPIPKERWTAEYTEKMWGIKIKNVKYILYKPPERLVAARKPVAYLQGGYYVLVLEFTKDLKADELKSVRRGFEPIQSKRRSKTKAHKRDDDPDTTLKNSPNNQLEFHFFDEDRVVVDKCKNGGSGYRIVEGDLTGRKGDAFRIIIDATFDKKLQPPLAAKIKKVEIRLPIEASP